MSHTPTTLVLGANGKTGRRVADRLMALGYPVRRGSRQATPAFDWFDAGTWPGALRGVEQVYITFQPDLAFPGALEIIERWTAVAVEAGVKRLVLLSGRGEPLAQACEAVIQGSGVAWTIVRASWFADNFSEGAFQPSIAAGIFTMPVGPVGEPFICADDIAEIAAAALTEPGHDGQLYEVTGPSLLTFAEAVSIISEVSGRPVQYLQVSPEQYLDGLLQAQVPPPVAGFLTELLTTVLDGRNAQVTDGVQRALGRPARSFADWAREAAALGVWGA